MRKYKNSGQERLTEVICNLCGKKIPLEKGVPQEGVFHGEADWGYFSEKDGEHHSFDLCESCYDKMLEQFQIPAQITEKTEFM